MQVFPRRRGGGSDLGGQYWDLAINNLCGGGSSCVTGKIRMLNGDKTVGVVLHSGTGTFKVQCNLATGGPTVTKATLTDTGSTAFTTPCEQLWVDVTNCSACDFDAYAVSTGNP
jgi:hypothetical protein